MHGCIQGGPRIGKEICASGLCSMFQLWHVIPSLVLCYCHLVPCGHLAFYVTSWVIGGAVHVGVAVGLLGEVIGIVGFHSSDGVRLSIS